MFLLYWLYSNMLTCIDFQPHNSVLHVYRGLMSTDSEKWIMETFNRINVRIVTFIERVNLWKMFIISLSIKFYHNINCKTLWFSNCVIEIKLTLHFTTLWAVSKIKRYISITIIINSILLSVWSLNNWQFTDLTIGASLFC